MNNVRAPPVSAQKPCIGVSLVMRRPIVRTMRQPPINVPRPIAAWQEITTQNGIVISCPAEMGLGTLMGGWRIDVPRPIAAWQEITTQNGIEMITEMPL